MIDDSALVVFSGGQDSTTCLYWAKQNFKRAEGICRCNSGLRCRVRFCA